jgi:hypothetical protein
MNTKRVKFTFPPDLVRQPVVYTMGKQFGVVTNLRRANIGHDRGWVILELVGTETDIDKALSWAREQGVRVEPIEGEPST